MQLTIDTTKREVIKINLDDKKYSRKAKTGSQVLLLFINEVLSKNKLKYSDVTSVKVKTGPGSFTGIRVGVSVAQTIAYYNGINLNNKDVTQNSIRIDYE